jgi:hypothetical protein
VDLFLAGEWVSRAVSFVLCTSHILQAKTLTDEIEKQRERLRTKGIGFEIWDSAELDILLKNQAAIVDDFFGRDYAEKFCQPEAIGALHNHISGPAVAELRARLGTLYTRIFAAHDPGLPVELGAKTATPLRDRYVLPDVYEDRLDSGPIAAEILQPDKRSDAAFSGHGERSEASRPSTLPSNQIVRQRRSLNDWLTNQTRQILIGGPGLGKSVLLRYVALDLLNESPVLRQASSFHDTFLPVWLSFHSGRNEWRKRKQSFRCPTLLSPGFTSGVRIVYGP